MTIKFFQPPVAPGTAFLSPFCAKLDMLLQISGLPFERHVEGDPRQGPKQKVPFIEDNGSRIGDTFFIERHLRETQGFDSLQHLSATERAIGNMIMATVEEKLYWVLVYGRWQSPANAQVMKDIFFGEIPDKAMRDEMANGAETMMRQTLYGQGMGRHSEAEVLEIGMQIIDDLSTILAESDYFFGTTPTSIDASVFGALVNFVHGPIQTPIANHIGNKPNLVSYMDRISHQYFPNIQKQAA
ncbi:glutathione S-transferase [Maritalea mobilis]|uniref:Glutathione S-transferase n=1 Tax=Maritalea mobilis TaxID=483324 RepID=A0A4R6W0L4_9HYPH|nr:glutathione S-transferase family protein [Maritalea mobilis]TDQ66465.1 glutathione S-transferase [Maritalea mobilis]